MTDTQHNTGRPSEPREIMQEGTDGLRINWADGKICLYRAAELRRECPCAHCVNEWTGEKILQPQTIPDELTIENISLVGRYALNFIWSDKHDAGIYSFVYLRNLCEGGSRAQLFNE